MLDTVLNAINAHPVFVSVAIICSFWTAWYVPSLRDINPWHDVAFQKIIHQYLMNLSGSLIGWFAFYYLLFQRPSGAVGIVDLIIILIAYVGITGYLPHLIIHKGFKP